MKNFKFLLLSLICSIGLLTGCNQAKSDYVPVERITTSKSVLNMEEEDYEVLTYIIYPANATNKSVDIDTSYANGTINITVDEYNNIIVWAYRAGNGTISLITENGKFVSYSINVSPKAGPDMPEPVIHDANDINDYFNAQVASYGYVTEHVENDTRGGVYLKEGWYFTHGFELTNNDSLDNLSHLVYLFRGYLPQYLLRFTESYQVATATDSAQYTLVMVNSNITCAATLYSFLEDGHLQIEIFIYDYNTVGGIFA